MPGFSRRWGRSLTENERIARLTNLSTEEIKDAMAVGKAENPNVLQETERLRGLSWLDLTHELFSRESFVCPTCNGAGRIRREETG